MHEFIPANYNAHVRRELSHAVMQRVEENEIAGAEITRVHFGPCLKLL